MRHPKLGKNASHPFSDAFALEIEAEVAGEAGEGIHDSVARVLGMIEKRSMGWMVDFGTADGMLVLFLHRDDVGSPGDPLPTWTDERPDLEDVILATRILHQHLDALECTGEPVLLTDIEPDPLADGEEAAR